MIMMLAVVSLQSCLAVSDTVELAKDSAAAPAAATSTPAKIDALRMQTEEDKEAALAKVQQINNIKKMKSKLEARIAEAKMAKKAAADAVDKATDHVGALEKSRRKIDRAVDDGKIR